MRKIGLVLMAAVMSLTAISCTNNDDDETGTTTSTSPSSSSSVPRANTTVAVTEKDFDIDLNSSNVDNGTVRFNVTNRGPSTHEFVVFKTDLEESALPMTADATVDENAGEVKIVDEIEDINANSSKSLSVDLDGGHYVLICNIPGHYKLGMHVAFDVES